MSINNLIVVPYYEDIAASEFCKELAKNISADDHLIVVDDGSVKKPFCVRNFSDNKINGTLVTLARNVGHQLAINIGVKFAVDEYDFETLVVMDSDGEDIPSDITKLTQKLSSDELDVVVSTRKSRVESWKFKAFYSLYKLLFRILVGRIIDFGNFMAMTKPAAKRIAISSEASLHLAAAVINSRLSVGSLSLNRGARYLGKSKMNWVSLTLHGLRSIMVFSDQVLVRITLFSVFFAFVIVVAMVAITLFKLTGAAIPGWFSTGGGILLVLLFQVGFMALIMLMMSGSFKGNIVSSFDYKKVIAKVEYI